MRSSSPVGHSRKILPSLPSDFHEVVSKFFRRTNREKSLRSDFGGRPGRWEIPSRCGIVIGGEDFGLKLEPPMSTMSDPEPALVVDDGMTSNEGVNKAEPKATQTAGSGLDHLSDEKMQKPVLVSSG